MAAKSDGNKLKICRNKVLSHSEIKRSVSDIIKLKTRTKIASGYSSEFLNIPLKAFFEKKSTEDITISSVHGVKGESFDATLLIVDSTRGKNAYANKSQFCPIGQ